MLKSRIVVSNQNGSQNELKFYSFVGSNLQMKASTLLYLLATFQIGCTASDSQRDQAQMKSSEMKKPLLSANRGMVNKEKAEIDAYILRRNWQMESTGSGLRYMIYTKGSGEQALAGKYALIRYVITLLDGTECYRSTDKPDLRPRARSDYSIGFPKPVRSDRHEASFPPATRPVDRR